MEIPLNVGAALFSALIYVITIVVLHKRSTRKLIAVEEQYKADNVRAENARAADLAKAKARAVEAEREAKRLREHHREAKQNAFDRVYNGAQAEIAEPIKKRMGSTTGRLNASNPDLRKTPSYASHPSNGTHYRDEGAFVNGLFLGAVLSDTVEDAFETNSAVQQDVIHYEPVAVQEPPIHTAPAVYDNSPSYSAPEPSYSSPSFDSPSGGGGDF